MDVVFLIVIVFFAILTQAISGSGLALISMPLLVQFMDPIAAATLVALIAVTTQLVMLSRYHKALRIQGLWRLMIGSLIGIPIGIVALAQLDKQVILTVLGLLLIGFSLYSLFSPQLPEIRNRSWGYLYGFVSGLLGGAYNTGGPPYVIYGMSSRWKPSEFKANLQMLLMVNSVVVVVGHLLAGHYTELVWRNYLIALPVILLAAGLGFWLDRYIPAERFRRIIQVLLLAIGIRMLIP